MTSDPIIPRQPHLSPPDGRWRAGRPPLLTRLALGVAALTGAIALAGCQPAAPTPLQARNVVTGLSSPWDLAFTPARSMIWTEKGGRIMRRTATGAVNQMAADQSDLFVGSETGLMGVVVDPAFTANRRIYTCQGWTSGGRRDVRVIPWVVNQAGTVLARQAPLVTGIPSTSGRHGGCRLRFDAVARLYVGTGDAAVGTNPQDLGSLGGKVLRIDRMTGQGVGGNPFIGSSNANARRIYSYGHRNVQGLAVRPGSGSLWSVEHGPDRDDEVNRILAANYGWNPVPGYNESVPMTDRAEFPQARVAAWSSGAPTVAPSGASWVSGGRWKTMDDTLVVATLKGESLLVLAPQPNGSLKQVGRLFLNQFGRLRTVQMGPDNNLYITTSNGSNDRIIRISPV